MIGIYILIAIFTLVVIVLGIYVADLSSRVKSIDEWQDIQKDMTIQDRRSMSRSEEEMQSEIRKNENLIEWVALNPPEYRNGMKVSVKGKEGIITRSYLSHLDREWYYDVQCYSGKPFTSLTYEDLKRK